MRPQAPSLPFRSLRSLLPAIVAAAVGVPSLAGCAGSGRIGGSGLSEAADRARVEPEKRETRTKKERTEKERDTGKEKKERRDGRREDEDVLQAGIPVRERHPHPRTVVIVDSYAGEPEYEYGYETEDLPGDDPGELFAGFSVGGILAGSNHLGNGGRASVRIGGIFPETGRRMGGELETGMGWSRFKGALGSGFDNPWEFSLAASIRYYVAPPGRPANVYVLGGLRGALLRWDYRSPLTIEDEYGDRFVADSDWITTWSPFAGAGFVLLRSGEFELGTQITVGARFYEGYTYHGLRNDVFDPEMLAEVRFDLSSVLR